MRAKLRRLAAALVLCALPAHARAAETQVRVGINSLTAIYWPTYLARDQRMFQAHGIAPDIILDGSPVAGLQQLIAGSLDIAHPPLAVAVTGAAKGAPACIDLKTFPVKVEGGRVHLRVA